MRALALALTVATGLSGLAYEVAWEKWLATLLGSHSEATAAVLGIFLGGLSLGYALFGRVTRALVERARRAGERPRLLAWYGLLEIAIGVYVIAFPALFRGAQALSVRLPHGSPALDFAVDVALAALLIGPPTILMGGTIPMLTQALARGLADATRFHALVYAFNTAGAFLGALLAGFVLVPQLGLVRVMLAMGTINLVAGAVFVVAGRRPGAAVLAGDTGAAQPAPRFRSYALASCLLGFAAMTLQSVVMRLGAIGFGASQFTFSMVVAVFVLCIALGSFAVSAFRRLPAAALPVTLWLLAAAWLGLYPWLEDTPYWVYRLRLLFGTEPSDFYPFQLGAFAALLLVLGPAVAASGATLPLLFHRLRGEVGELGAAAGRLYAWNTVGSMLGALLGGYALLFWLDLHHTYRIAVAALVLAAAVVCVGFPRGSGWRLVAAPLALASGVALVALPGWPPHKLAAALFRERAPLPGLEAGPDAFLARHRPPIAFISYDDDPTASIAVVTEILSDPKRRSRALLNNGKSEGSTWGDRTTMRLLALLPVLFAEKAERVFLVGWGTGLTVRALADLDETRSIVAAEISPAVIHAAGLFDLATEGVHTDPRVHIVRSDAYRALLRSEGRFDVILSQPSNPWINGVEVLYAREFLLQVRDRLEPGGVYAQFFHLYETDAESVALILRSFAAVFPAVAVWHTQGNELLLLGMQSPDALADFDRLERRAARPDFRLGLERAGVAGFAALLAHETLPLGVVHAAGLEGPLHSLSQPRLSYAAGRGFFEGHTASLPFTGRGEAARVGEASSLLRRYVARRGGRLASEEQALVVNEACKIGPARCATMIAWWAHEDPGSPQLAELRARMGRRFATSPVFGAETLRRLEGLFAGLPVAAAAGSDGRERLLATYYLAAAPFAPRPAEAGGSPQGATGVIR